MKAYTLTSLVVAGALGSSLIASAAPQGPKGPKDQKPRTHHLTFAQADADVSGDLTVFEFAKTLGPGMPMVQVRKQFLLIDTSGAFEELVDPVTGEPVQGDPLPDGLVTLDEIKAFRALEEKPKSELTKFELADFSGDGFLDLVEYGYLVSPKVPSRNTERKFVKLDLDEDDLISPAEFRKPKPVL